ncbi:MAG: glycosyltransferase family 39 protein [Microcoleaceae cyanobacterium]
MLSMQTVWFRRLLLLVLVIGIFFRLINLDKKVYWHDEVYTSIRVLGHSPGHIVERLFTGKVITPDEVLQFQRPTPENDLSDVWIALKSRPEHPPLYYLLARFWITTFGSSVAAIRSLSVLISLFMFPSLYWLCWELFQLKSVGWVAVVLFAISPFHVLYAQEAREYSLWTVLILLSSAALLRAVKPQEHQKFWGSIRIWGVYILTSTLCLYTSLLSVLVAISHGFYVLLLEKFKPTRTLFSFLMASAIVTVLYSPWLSNIATNFEEMQGSTRWLYVQQTWLQLIVSWQLNFSSVAIDLHPEVNHFVIPRLIVFLLVGFGYCLYILRRQSSDSAQLFLLTLLCIPSLSLILPDLIQGGQRSTLARYLTPSLISVQIIIAYALSNLPHPVLKVPRIGCLKYLNQKSLIVFFIIVGILSCAVSSQADTWWTKPASYSNPRIADIINQSSSPLVISDNSGINIGNLISLSHLLHPHVRLQFVEQNSTDSLQISSDFSDIFLYGPSDSLATEVQKQTDSELERIDNVFEFYRVNLVDKSAASLKSA